MSIVVRQRAVATKPLLLLTETQLIHQSGFDLDNWEKIAKETNETRCTSTVMLSFARIQFRKPCTKAFISAWKRLKSSAQLKELTRRRAGSGENTQERRRCRMFVNYFQCFYEMILKAVKLAYQGETYGDRAQVLARALRHVALKIIEEIQKTSSSSSSSSSSCRYLAIDIETSGNTGVPQDFPTQISVFECGGVDGIANNKLLYDSFVCGSSVLSTKSQELTKTTVDFLNKNGKSLDTVLADLDACLQDNDVLVFHNASYDWDTVLKNHARVWCNNLTDERRGVKITCTCKGPLHYSSWSSSESRSKWLNLSELCDRFGVCVDDPERMHTSSYDAHLLACCVQKALSQGLCV